MLTWNIEGFSRNRHSLRNFTERYQPSLVLLSEPMTHQADLPLLLQPFSGKYAAHLNSEDLHDHDLAIESSRAHGGTMIMWLSSLSPFITILPTVSSSFLTILLKPDDAIPSLHTVIYLPTAGKDDQFFSVLADLTTHIDETRLLYPDIPHFVRGDANSNPNNVSRSKLFSHFYSSLEFMKIPLYHPTYHHFIGDGCFDSEIDFLLYYGTDAREDLDRILCKLDSPLINSHHDVILSTCSIPVAPPPPPEDDLVVAPKIPNIRTRTVWSEEGIRKYESIIDSSLTDLRERWGNSSSKSSLSVLLSSTYSLLAYAAKTTNKSISLSSSKSSKPKISPNIRRKERNVLKCKKALDAAVSTEPSHEKIEAAKDHLRSARASLRQALRSELSSLRNERDMKLSDILSTTPAAAHRSIRTSKNAATSEINNLKVGNKIYSGKNVSDGFYDSLSSLKSPDMEPLYSSLPYQETLLDYENIMKIANNATSIPPISPNDSTRLLYSLKADVNDFYSITANHFIHAGFEGLEHFHFLLNIIIEEINSSSLEELNTVWACILFKGHGKNKESDRSYRTISTCPLVAKALDSYIGSLYSAGWADAQADTQFQGSGSSHELAALLLSESLNFSLYSLKKPMFLLLLDAKSAFDLIPKESIIVNAFKAGTTDQGLVYLDNRLGNRLTYCEWSKTIMGPIIDKLGVEQGGVNSDKLYKLANNDQLNVAQLSDLGVQLGTATISAIGQADDSALLANDIHSLNNLLLLTLEYCQRYNVTLVPEKTKLLAFCPPGQEHVVEYAKIISPVNINANYIPFSESAEHVGIIRSIHGNGPSILARISAHKKAVFSLLPSGLARGHRGNPAASVRVERLYGIPVLLSGLATIVLSTAEIATINSHFKKHLQCLLKLHKATPAPVVWFLAGCLPLEALLHLRIFSIYGMLTRLKDGNNVLAVHARDVLSSAKPSSKSWFLEVQKLCLQYLLPHPITFLDNPPTKSTFKRLVKSAVTDYWEKKLRGQAFFLRDKSLRYFNPNFMSLSRTHPIFLTCGSSPYELSKAVIQARALSGRARVESLTKHWDKNNDGICSLCRNIRPTEGTIEHLLLLGGCPALVEARLSMISMIQSYLVPRPYLLPIFRSHFGNDDLTTMQFLLDCSVLPDIISISQESETPILTDIFYLTRSYVFKIFVTRRRLITV